MSKSFSSIEQNMAYQFKDANLIKTALTHKSFCVGKNKDVLHNERLEFLGDAVLGLVIAEDLMKRFPQDTEGALSKKRASLVNQDILSQKAKKLSLNEKLILGPGEAEQESHLKPRILASAYEALLGALYSEAGFEKVQKYIVTEFHKDIQDIKPDLEYEKDYKTRLQELTQKLNLGTPTYELVLSSGPSHKPEFLVCLKLKDDEKVRATGASKKAAEQMAAQMLLEELSGKSKTGSTAGKITKS